MRVIICMDHRMLMEPRSENSEYVECARCAPGKRWSPNWFPIKFALRNHADGSMKRTWEWVYGLGGRWERILTDKQKEFYVARREAQATLKAQAETKFVCNPCRIAAENGLRGEKNHKEAGCKGCDCQHMERDRITE